MRNTISNTEESPPSDEESAANTTAETCAVCLEKPEPPYSLPCNHIFCYLCLKQAAETGGMQCPLCRAVIPDFVLEEAKISDEVFVLEDKAGNWMYSGRTDGWWFYAPETDDVLEASWGAYQNGGASSINVDILGRTYVINFENMEQSCASNGTTRNIKRAVDINEGELVKGLAGLRVMPQEEMPEMPEPEYSNPNTYTFNTTAWLLSGVDTDDEDHSLSSDIDSDDL